MDNIYKRFAKAEAMANAQKNNTIEIMLKRYKNACKNKNEEEACKEARNIRNKLLDISDKEMVLDRLSVDTSNEIELLKSLSKIFNGDWAIYRQKLRDLPSKKGFPFDIEFPNKPKEIGEK